ncbi:MAG: TonB-dependent receptor [Steroidobacteraceae bacterium]
MRTSRSLLTFAITAAAVNTSVVYADTGAPALEEVVVSARKQAEAIQDVPLAVSAVTADQVRSAGIRDVGDLTVVVPSLVVTSNSNPFNTSYRIRRIGNEGNIPDFEPDTGLFIDGAYRSRSGLGLGDLADIEQIEVLRGPQSTLYGRNVTAGAISVATAKPSQTFGAMVETTGGNDNLLGVRGYLTGGVTETVSARLSASGTWRDAMAKNLIGGDSDDLDQYSVRFQVLVEPSDNLSVRLIGTHTRRDMKPALADMFYGPSVSALVNAVVANPAALGAADGPALADGLINSSARPILDNDPDNREVQALAPLTFEQSADDLIASFEYRTDTMTVTSISSYDRYDVTQRWNDAGQTGLDLVDYRDTQYGRTFSQELRLSSTASDSFKWLSGVYYYDNRFERGDKDEHEFELGQAIDELGVAAGIASPTLPNVPVFGLPGDTGDFFETSDSKSYGLFGQGTWNATDRLALTLGLRYTREEKDVSLVNTPATTAPGPLAALSLPVRTLTPATSSFSLNDEWDAITGTFNVSYHVNPDVMTYASVATGFKGGGYNGGFGNTTLAKRPFKSEDVVSYELGAKSELGGRVRLNAAAFWSDYTDFQSASYIGLQFLVNNAEKVRVKGVEMDLTASLTNDLTLDLSATYADASYEKYTQGSCYTGRTPDDPVTGGCDLSGKTLPFAPKLTATAGVQWQHTFGPGDLYSRLDGNWVGDQNVTSELDANHGKQDGYGLLNFRLGWKQQAWDVSLWARNLTDKTFIAQTAQSNLFSALQDGTYQNYLGAPRSYGITVRAKY